MSESEQAVLYEVKGQAAWFTINRPARRNALNGEAIQLLGDYLTEAEEDPNVRVLCVTGTGEKAFCAGADLTSGMSDGGGFAAIRAYAELLNRMTSYPKPMVARVNGHCLAGGLGLLLSCDIAYAHDGCKFGTPEVGVGLFPMMIGALISRDAVRKKVAEMIYTARRYSAREAEKLGFLTRVYPAGELDGAIDSVLTDIAARSPTAIRMGRQALAAIETMDFPDAVNYLCEQLWEVIRTEDAIEGLTAFLQKRKPVWKGK